jgi:uncharacterized protein (UPF0276 family)
MPHRYLVGIGLRKELIEDLKSKQFPEIQFLEIAPENWIEVGGKRLKDLHYFTEKLPFFCHGLSLNLGGTAPLRIDFLKKLKNFLNNHQIKVYSEHLSYCGDEGYLYDLFPIPFTEAAVRHTALRIKQAQEILERPIAIENASYYLNPPISEMDESTFIQSVLKEADCQLLLDINNVYVNSVNHRYDPIDFLKKIPTHRISYLHIAGHHRESLDLIIDTHGASVVDPVWKLLKAAYRIHGIFPTLLERDFNLPPLKELLREVKKIHSIQKKARSVNGQELRAVSNL